MANATVNKVVLGSETLLDLTSDTVTPSTLMLGYTAHDKSGATVTGTLSFVTYHVSASDPASSDGSDGDIWLVTE